MTQAINIPRCAVYVRVSTDHEEQVRSAGNQITDIPHTISESGKGTVEGLYIDNGITGTKADRPEFQRLIEDARNGKFDYIVTKNISRFARSVVIAVQYIQELKALPKPVGVYFMEERLDTLQPGVDFMLTLLSAVAEQESRNISEHIMATFNSKIDQGVKVNGSSAFGYDCITDANGKRTLVPNADAETVKRIYKWYLEGLSTVQIAHKLKEEYGIVKRATSVTKILHNEVYAGDLKQRKQQTRGVRGKRFMSPEGETVVIKNNHIPIVSREDFEKVQKKFEESGRGRFSRDRHALSGLITCGRCGCTYCRHSVRDGMAWVCSSYQKTYNQDPVLCKGKKFKTTHEETIMRLYEQAVNFLCYDQENTRVSHFTKEQDRTIKQVAEDLKTSGAENTIRNWIQGIQIGTETIDRLLRFDFTFGVSVVFQTHPQDTRYKDADCTIEVKR